MKSHKGTELNNIKETWQQNLEQKADANSRNAGTDETTTISTSLQQTIKEEAAEYDNANKEDRILDGDRATVNDDDNSNNR